MHDCIFGCNMHPCPVTHLVFADRYVPSDSSLPLPAAHSGPISPYIEIWGKRGRKRILSLSFVSFCVSATNYTSNQVTNCFLLWLTTITYLQSMIFICSCKSSGRSEPFTRRGSRKPLPPGCPKTNQGDRAMRTADRILTHLTNGMLYFVTPS